MERWPHCVLQRDRNGFGLGQFHPAIKRVLFALILSVYDEAAGMNENTKIWRPPWISLGLVTESSSLATESEF
jgi:hypothetical protein